MGEMRSALASSSPASQGGTSTNTPATRITSSAPQTIFNDSKNARSGDDLAFAMSSLATGSDNDQSDDPFLDPASDACKDFKSSGLSPIASAFTPKSFGSDKKDDNTSNLAAQVKFAVAGSQYRLGVFTSELGEAQRAILVVSQFSTVDRIKRLLKEMNIGPDVFSIETSSLNIVTADAAAKCLLVFKDPAVAQLAYHGLVLNLDRVTISYQTPKAVATFRGLDAGNTSLFDGELSLTVFWDELSMPVKEEILCQYVKIAMERSFGPIKAIDRMPSSQARVRDFRLEFVNIGSTANALTCREGIKAFGLIIQVSQYQPDIAPAEDEFAQSVFSGSGTSQSSLTGRSVMPAATALATSLPVARIVSSRRARTDNRIDIGAILNGEDCRTTIMLRNIPNRVNIHHLKSIIDSTSAGVYDFVYLRIDFRNQCNVGYAFINFSDALSVVPFARARQGVRWTMFDSDKVAELSYATIQDRENLIQKFRNSSVMLEHPDFRPKLFFALPDPRAGQEESFPNPDNLQKMRRSMENAETIGLFHPQAYRSRRRRRGVQGRPMGRPGFYLAPARVAAPSQGARGPRRGVGSRSGRVATLSPQHTGWNTQSPAVFTPPPTPLRENMDQTRATVPLNSPADAFTNFLVIRAQKPPRS